MIQELAAGHSNGGQPLDSQSRGQRQPGQTLFDQGLRPHARGSLIHPLHPGRLRVSPIFEPLPAPRIGFTGNQKLRKTLRFAKRIQPLQGVQQRFRAQFQGAMNVGMKAGS